MSDKLKFLEVAQVSFPMLANYVPVVDRVHGAHHPEFHEVRRVFDVIIKKTKASQPTIPDLKEEFAQLREITHDYAIPTDVCETYEAVFKMLKEVDDAYQG